MVSAPFTSHPENPIKSWEQLIAVENNFGIMAVGATSVSDEWAFRGQNTSAFPATSFERLCNSLGLTGGKVVDLEVKLIRDFARRYHQYGGLTPPPKGNTLEWLALLQHYGTPTRLTDFTYSFFIAAYFAVEAATADSTIWAVNTRLLAKKARGHIESAMPNGKVKVEKYLAERDAEPFRALFMHQPPLRFVDLASPIRLNERLTLQQGLFLAPGDVTVSFEDNVRAAPDHAKNFIQVIIDSSCRHEIIRKLHRFGINAASLFPGLDGFARSLRTKSLILADLPMQGVELLQQI